jgi:hypothetical protein
MTAIALLCLVLLCTAVQLDCSLVALQANFEDPFLEPSTVRKKVRSKESSALQVHMVVQNVLLRGTSLQN